MMIQGRQGYCPPRDSHTKHMTNSNCVRRSNEKAMRRGLAWSRRSEKAFLKKFSWSEDLWKRRISMKSRVSIRDRKKTFNLSTETRCLVHLTLDTLAMLAIIGEKNDPWNPYILPYMAKTNGLCRCNYINSLEMGSSPWIIRVDPECNHECPYEREAEGDLMRYTQNWNMQTEQRASGRR